MESLSQAKITSERRIQSEHPKELTEALAYFWENKPTLYREALAMYHKVIKEKLNWRDFGVGAAAVAYNSNTKEYKIITGWNTKEKQDDDKHCAEKRVYEFAQKEGFDKIVGIVVVAEHQKPDSEVACSTLHPCAVCQDMLRQSPLSWGNMPIVTMSVPPSPDILFPESESESLEYSLLEEQHTLDELLKKHGNSQTDS
jgi:cytidine deaminase